MTASTDDPMDKVQRELAAWHATHPRATFAEIEAAVEERLHRLRAPLMDERLDALRQEEHPACPHCGTTMIPRRRTTRTVLMPGDEAIAIERPSVVCPACGTGLFPPG